MSLPLATSLLLAAALGCGSKKQETPGSPEATAGASASKILATFGAKGGSVYAEQLVARDDGGYLLAADVLGSVKLGAVTIKGNSEERVHAVIALDASAKVRWAHTFDGHCSGTHIAARGTATLFSGSCSTPIDGPSGPVSPVSVDDHLHIFTAMLDDKGAVQWAKYAGNAGHQVENAAALDAAGNVYVVGMFADPIDFGTGLLEVPAGHRSAAFVASFDPAGKARWAKTYPDAEVQAVLASQGEIEIAGVFTTQTTIGTVTLTAPVTDANKSRKDKGGRFFARLSPETGEATSAAVVGESASSGQELARDANGTIYDSADSLEGLVLFAIDKENKSTSLHVIPASAMETMMNRPLVIDHKGRLLQQLTVNKPRDFGGGMVNPSGTGDAIVLAFDAKGTFTGQTVLQGPGQDNSGALAVGTDGTVLAAWVEQSGPAGQRYEDWLITDVYYVTKVQRIAP